MVLARVLGSAFILVAAAGPALGHTGVGATHGFAAGLSHPLGGADHVLAMVAVGLFAAALGGRALWAVPASFVAMMLAGAGLALTGTPLPGAETGIALSVAGLGALLALGRTWPLGAATALVGAFALFHGYAHAAELPAGASALAFGAGFALATALLHGTGIGIGRVARGRPDLVRLGGVGLTLAGLALALA